MITVFSIVMVFLVLIIISIFISFLKNIDNKEKKEISKTSKSIANLNQDISKAEEDKTVDDEELVAVISAAIAASLGVSIPEISIKKISRISENTTAWSMAARQEQVNGKL